MKNFKFIAAVAFAAQLNCAQAQNLLVGLQACYPLDNSAANMASTGSALNGIPSTVSGTTDRFGNANAAYAFTGGTNSYVELPNDSRIKPTNSISFSAWIKITGTNSQYIVFTKNTCFQYFEGYALLAENVSNNLKLTLVKSSNPSCNGTTQQVITGGTTLNTGTWYHVGFYAGTDSLKLFLNGGLQNSAPVGGVAFSYDSSKKVYLGGTNESFNMPFTGSMDAVRFYDRKLGNTEFYQLATSVPTCSYSLSEGLQACYPLNCDTINYAPTAGTPPSLNGTRYNVVCDTGHTNAVNTAYKFAGLNTSYIKLPNDARIKPTNAISFSAWSKLDANTASYQYIVFAKNTCSSWFEGYTLEAIKFGTQIKYQVAKSNGSVAGCGTQGVLLSTNAYNPFTWHHIVFYVDNYFIKLYVDGVLDNMMTSTIQLNYDASNVILGGTNQSFNGPLNGSLDNVRFYNRELTAKEINILNYLDPTCNTTWHPCFAYNNIWDYIENCHNENKTVGLNSTEASDNTVKLYPNPSSGTIYIHNAKNKSLMIYDVNGKLIQHTFSQLDENTGEINLKNNARGLYFVKIMDATGNNIQTTKIILAD